MKAFKYSLAVSLILLSLLIINSCDDQEKFTDSKPTYEIETRSPVNEYKSEENQTAPVKNISLDPPATDNFNTQDMRMIIKTGEMNIETERFDETENKIKETVKKFNAYITNSSSLINPAGKKHGSITIRVASSDFDNLISSLKTIDKISSLNVSGRDVTEEYLDLEARLKTQKELEARLIRLLQEKTANLTSVVEVETKLASVRENIEKTEGRIRYLRNQTAYSTLKVSYYEPSVLNTSTGGGFFYEIGESISRGLTGLTKVISGMITFTIAASPILTFLGIALYLGLKYIRRRKTLKPQTGS
ncbi:MAG: DUF4349 domain-containing protein [Ignavibacteria bacterium]|nr:DUF4349 domain-containing protein [Ignavibacteria bacterium]